MFLVVSTRATAGACELLQRFVALFGFNWRSFSRKKLRCFDQVWMKFYILNMSLRADTDEKMRCMCEICIHEYISTKLMISVIFEVSSVLRNFSTLPVSCPGNSGTVGSSAITSHFPSHIYMLSVHEAIKISYLYHLVCQGSRNSQKSDVSNHSVVCWHGSVAFPILPIDIENLSRLSKCTLPIISIPKPLKLLNCQTRKYRILCPSLTFVWRVSDNQVELRSDAFFNSYGTWHAITL